MFGDLNETLPAYIAGAVIEHATVVEIRFPNGAVVRVPTVAGPEALRHIRFYVAQLPAGIRLTPENLHRTFPSWVAGLDAGGEVVACLAPRTEKNGVSPLTDCR
jgi:hypothetical protein